MKRLVMVIVFSLISAERTLADDSIPVITRADDLKELSEKEWEAVREKLSGHWHSEEKLTVQVYFAFQRRERRLGPGDAISILDEVVLAIDGNLDKALRRGILGRVHSKTGVFWGGNQVGHGDLFYKFEKEALILMIQKGDAKGVHRLYKMDMFGGTAVRPVGHAARVAELKLLEGKWATDPKKPLKWELSFDLTRKEGEIIGCTASVDTKPKPSWSFGQPLGKTAFRSSASGKRKFLLFGGGNELDFLEYRVDGDELIVAVPDGPAEGIYTLRRVK